MTKTTVSYFEISGPSSMATAELAAFYQEAVGLLSAPHPDDESVNFVPPSDGGIPGFLFSGGPGFDSETYAVLYIQVDDVDATVEAVTAAGGTVLSPPHQHGPVRAAHIADPAGNRIGVFTGDPG